MPILRVSSPLPHRLFILFCCLSGISLTASAADIQHWIDEKGRHHFSDKASANSNVHKSKNSIQQIPAATLPKLKANSEQTNKDKNKRLNARQKERQKIAKTKAKQEYKCRRYQEKIRKINNKLRRGHNNSQGNRWRQQRRDYQQLSYEQCR